MKNNAKKRNLYVPNSILKVLNFQIKSVNHNKKIIPNPIADV